MNEVNKAYIDYLNSLNSYNAKNKNAYSEKNVENEFYKSTAVEIGVAKSISEKIKNEEPQVIILSGQAGDGKTSIMYQVSENLDPNYKIQTNENIFEISCDGKCCKFVKDFSEFSSSQKIEKLKEILEYPHQNKFAFVVANTGPLINSFGELFSFDEKEKAKMEFIESIKNSDGEVKDIFGHKISIINMASIDNSYFAPKFLEKILQADLWQKCVECEKHEYCPILRNKNLIMQNPKSVQEFLENHYIYLSEYGTKLTVRSITEQLSFMITGGLNCNSVKDIENSKYLYPNLFFGFGNGRFGFEKDLKALRMTAIKETSKHEYYLKKMRIDEQLILKSDYERLFSAEWVSIIRQIENKVDQSPNLNKQRNDFYAFLHRVYIFQNTCDDDQRKSDVEDVFSKNFVLFLNHRTKNSKFSSVVKNSILNALSMIYTGTKVGTGGKVPITLNKKSCALQSVQFVTGYLDSDDFEIEKVKSNDGKIRQTEDIYYFYPKVKEKRLDVRLSLPLFDYLYNLQKGIIQTDIDPLLSHGIESLKAQIAELTQKNKADDEFTLFLLKKNQSITKKLEICDSEISII